MCGGKFDKAVDEFTTEQVAGEKKQILSWNPKITQNIDDSGVDPEGGVALGALLGSTPMWATLSTEAPVLFQLSQLPADEVTMGCDNLPASAGLQSHCSPLTLPNNPLWLWKALE